MNKPNAKKAANRPKTKTTEITELYQWDAHRTVNTYAYLKGAAREALNAGTANEAGSFFQFMIANVFSAFTLEAYLNHLGEGLFSYWDRLDKLSPSAKLQLVCDHLKVPYDCSRRPIQTIETLMKFRNSIAHGKTARLKGKKVMTKSKLDPGEKLLEAPWEKLCNAANAKRSLDDVVEIISKLHDAAGKKIGWMDEESKFAPFSLGSMGWQKSVVRK